MTTTGTGDVIVFAFASVQHTITGTSVSLAIQQDAGGYAGGSDAHAPVAGYGFMLVGCSKLTVPSAAAHTYNTGWRINSGSGTVSNGSSSRIILAVELRR